MRSKALLATP